MGGHVDDAERTYDHPVVSLSIGCPCIFLLGA
jgi:alkylated DNA repair dioxygenase AlkB